MGSGRQGYGGKAMRVLARLLITTCALAGAVTPAAASVSLSIDGTFLQSFEAVRQATGADTLNPRFSAGLLLSISKAPPTASYTMQRRNFYFDLNDFGLPRRSTPWWGYAINSYEFTSSSYSIAFDHERADADDPTYPLWSIPRDNGILIMFDRGVVPDILRFDLDAIVQQVRYATFQGVSTGDNQPFPDEENISSSLRPSTIQHGTIGCSSQQGSETLTSTTLAGFRPETFSSEISTRCSVALDVSQFIPVTPPPGTDPASAVPEPATWAMMIAGFSLIGHAMRRRKVLISLA